MRGSDCAGISRGRQVGYVVVILIAALLFSHGWSPSPQSNSLDSILRKVDRRLVVGCFLPTKPCRRFFHATSWGSPILDLIRIRSSDRHVRGIVAGSDQFVSLSIVIAKWCPYCRTHELHGERNRKNERDPENRNRWDGKIQLPVGERRQLVKGTSPQTA